MVKVSDIEKDIKSLAKKHKVAVFSYDEIHNPDVDTQFHYDYQKVIKEVAENQNCEEDQAEMLLFEREILRPLPNGEYEVDVGDATRRGGGLNIGGNLFFSFSKNDYHTKYHELAHTLQYDYNLFNKEKIDAIYEQSQSGVKNKQKLDSKLVDRKTYQYYLQEVHSEIFASAAMMLRAEDKRDFWWQAVQAYNSGVNRNMTALKDTKKQIYASNHSKKFYSTKSVMRPLIKEIRKIRKSGQLETYFDENGVLNGEKLAKLCEDVVLKNAYSPRTLNSFFNYKIFDGHTSQERGWKRDAVKTFFEKPLAMIVNYHNSLKKSYDSYRMHHRLRKQQHDQILDFVTTPRHHDDPEMKALMEYERLKNVIALKDREYQVAPLFSKHFLAMGGADMPDEAIQSIASYASFGEFSKKELIKIFTIARSICKENKDNKYFNYFMEANVSGLALKRFIEMKKNDPKITITPAGYQSKITYEPAALSVSKQMFSALHLCDKHKMSPKFLSGMIREIVNNPKAFSDPEVKKKVLNSKKFKNDFTGRKKFEFTSDVNLIFARIAVEYYSQRNNPEYQSIMKGLAAYSTRQLIEEIRSIEAANTGLTTVNMNSPVYEQSVTKKQVPVHGVGAHTSEPIHNPSAQAVQQGEDIHNPSAQAVQQGEDIRNPSAQAAQQGEAKDHHNPSAEAVQPIHNPSAQAVRQGEDIRNPSAQTVQQGEDIRNPSAQAVQQGEAKDHHNPSAEAVQPIHNPSAQAVQQGEDIRNPSAQAERNNENASADSCVSVMRQKLNDGHDPLPLVQENTALQETRQVSQTTLSKEQIQRKLQENVKS